MDVWKWKTKTRTTLINAIDDDNEVDEEKERAGQTKTEQFRSGREGSTLARSILHFGHGHHTPTHEQ